MAIAGSATTQILIILGVVTLFSIITFALTAATLGTLNKRYDDLQQQIADLNNKLPTTTINPSNSTTTINPSNSTTTVAPITGTETTTPTPVNTDTNLISKLTSGFQVTSESHDTTANAIQLTTS